MSSVIEIILLQRLRILFGFQKLVLEAGMC
jgi:hypothetical protein